MKTIYAFDFDGTLTTRDTLIEFTRYTYGKYWFFRVIMRHLHILILMKLHLYPNGKAKERFFNYLIRGLPVDIFDEICNEFVDGNRHLLRPKGMEAVRQAASSGCPVVIVTASIEQWVAPFFNGIEGVTIIGTKPEIVEDRITGNFASPNCYGKEKVRRLLELYPDRNSYRLIAYGDSRGDRELLAEADEAHYKPFR